MVTIKSGDTDNAAIAAILLDAKEQPDSPTFQSLSDETGISVRQLKRLLHDEQSLKWGDTMKIIRALNLDPAEVIEQADGHFVI